jgi:[ribosomal protein S18]-alanine N-acetyltransferase
MSTFAKGIRLARTEDANAIARMSRDTIEAGLGWSWRPQRVLMAIRDPNTLAIVCGEGRVQGFCITQFGDEIGHLSLLAVDPKFRRQGFGRKLVGWMLLSARTAGIATVHVEMRTTNLLARAFYRTIGFEDAGVVTGYYRGVESALRMVLSLRARDLPEVTWEPPLAWRRPAGS